LRTARDSAPSAPSVGLAETQLSVRELHRWAECTPNGDTGLSALTGPRDMI
jgi:hypothetical protein